MKQKNSSTGSANCSSNPEDSIDFDEIKQLSYESETVAFIMTLYEKTNSSDKRKVCADFLQNCEKFKNDAGVAFIIRVLQETWLPPLPNRLSAKDLRRGYAVWEARNVSLPPEVNCDDIRLKYDAAINQVASEEKKDYKTIETSYTRFKRAMRELKLNPSEHHPYYFYLNIVRSEQ